MTKLAASFQEANENLDSGKLFFLSHDGIIYCVSPSPFFDSIHFGYRICVRLLCVLGFCVLFLCLVFVKSPYEYTIHMDKMAASFQEANEHLEANQ